MRRIIALIIFISLCVSFLIRAEVSNLTTEDLRVYGTAKLVGPVELGTIPVTVLTTS